MRRSPLVVGSVSPEAAAALAGIGVKLFAPSPLPSVDERLALHADLVVFSPFPGRAVLAPSQTALAGLLEAEGVAVSFISREPCSPYPGDVALSGVVSGGRLICRRRSANEMLLSFFSGADIIDTHQGYVRCTSCALPDGAVITDDPDILRSAGKSGIECFAFDRGHVGLSGFDCGFIGGACGMVTDDILAFNGSYLSLPFAGELTGFLARQGVKPMSLTGTGLTDTGGLIRVA